MLRQSRDGSRAEREHAYAVLMDDFRGPAMSVICRTLRTAGVGMEHAEEVWQQSVFKFFAVGVHAYRGDASVRTYFVRSALYASVDLVRLAHRQRSASDQLDDFETDQHAPPLGQNIERIEALRACIAELSTDNARAISLYYLDEAGGCSQCAEELQISKDAFMKRLSRARSWLAQCVILRMKSH
ncbi:MAG: hypothetical protein JRH20_15305 [Deltaproteobacteria bacterium]|nr:hypothetical protein [Deltaproteobacteria bacterium]